jgi:hypothetical protein
VSTPTIVANAAQRALSVSPHAQIGQFIKQRLISCPILGLGMTLGTTITGVWSQKCSCGPLSLKGARCGPAVILTAAWNTLE